MEQGTAGRADSQETHDPEGIFSESQAILPPKASKGADGSSRGRLLRWAPLALGVSALIVVAAALGISRAPTTSGTNSPAVNGGELVAIDEEETLGFVAAPTTWTTTTSLPFPESTKDWPSLFCWLVAQTVGGQEINRPEGWWEEKLVTEMLVEKVGIFACNEFAVFTDKRALITTMAQWGWPYVDDDYKPKMGEITSWPLKTSTQTAKNGDSSPSNSWVFTAAWKALGGSGVLDKHHWVVKQDPDACFFPWRLRWHASQYPGQDGQVPVFIKNCQTFNSMQGPLEVFSIALVKAMLPQLDSCGAGAAGEDSKMEKCAQSAGGQQYLDGAALKDKYCSHTQPNCVDGNTIAFHPFKEIPNFRKCINDSMTAERNYKLSHPR